MSSLSDLTPRELQVLRWILAGYSNREIDLEIGILEKTVEFHLDRMYAKIGVHARIRAALWAIRQGVEIESGGIPS